MFKFQENDYYINSYKNYSDLIQERIYGNFKDLHEFLVTSCRKYNEDIDCGDLLKSINNLCNSYKKFRNIIKSSDNDPIYSVMIDISRTAFLIDLSFYNTLTPDMDQNCLNTIPNLTSKNTNQKTFYSYSPVSIGIDLIESYYCLKDWYRKRLNCNDPDELKNINSIFNQKITELKRIMNEIIFLNLLDLNLMNCMYYLTLLDFDKLNSEKSI